MIYDSSENIYHPAQPSQSFPFVNNEVFIVESLSTSISYEIILDGHHNLLSFHALPEDRSVENIFSGLGDNIVSILGEGSSSYYDGYWMGTLLEIQPEMGLWVSINDFPDTLHVSGFNISDEWGGGGVLNLHPGPNLVSFPYSGSIGLSEAIPDDIEHLFSAVLTEGYSAANLDIGWAGSLIEFKGGKGYWLIVDQDLEFRFNAPASDRNLSREIQFDRAVPYEYTFEQSRNQAFYFIESAEVDGMPLTPEDLIVAYNGDIVVGARYWSGDVTDVPVMGFDEGSLYEGYALDGDIITFKVLDASSNSLVLMEPSISINWAQNGLASLSLSEIIIPESISFGNAYPNPFNPSTNIDFVLPHNSEVLVEIYDINGKKIETLLDAVFDAGYHTAVWTADRYSSGIYFIKMDVSSDKGIDYNGVQKLMLIK